MNTFLAMVVGALSLLASSVVLAQTGSVMDGGGHGMGWGYGGLWGAVLLVALIVAIVVLANRKTK